MVAKKLSKKMAYFSNKNKNTDMLKIAGLMVLIAGFLLMPAFYLMAQEDTETVVNTDSNVITDEVGETSDQTVEEEAGDSDEEAGVNNLNQELDEKREAIEALKEKAEIFEKNIKVKQQEAVTLQNQLSLIDLQTEQTELDIETVRAEIDKVGLEIDSLVIAIGEKDVELDYHKEVLANYLRLIYKYDQQSYLEIFIANSSFSDFFDNLRYTQDLENNVNEALVDLKGAKEDLENQQSEKEAKKDELDELSTKLADSIVNFNEQKDYKSALLEETEESEEMFEMLLDDAKREQQAAESEIYSLESKVREKLEEGGVELDIEAALMWPISPVKGISAYFHDPTYIFRKYFEHPAIDIPAPQGTSIRSAESGYVARAKNAGLGYSYIMIVHNNEISTVYGHVSRIDVVEDEYVVRGQQIGLIGGTPGTTGAGRLTTGPHLHFEVRFGGIPVNPLDYLPSL